MDLEAVWGREAVILRERLCDAESPRECFTILETAMTQRIHTAHSAHGAVTEALTTFQRTSGQTSVRDIAKHVGLSQRRFIQVFAEQVGLTPKLFSRIQRFQRARTLAIGTGATGHDAPPPGRQIQIEDPDGNPIELFEPASGGPAKTR